MTTLDQILTSSNITIILTVVGLIFEFIPVILQTKKAGNMFKSRKEKKQDHYSEVGRPTIERIEENQRLIWKSFVLLFVGLFLQGIAVLIQVYS